MNVAAWIADATERYPDIVAITLIGSRERGDHRPDSDDLLLTLAPGSTEADERRLAVELRHAVVDVFFASGRTWKVQSLPRALGLGPYVSAAAWRVGGYLVSGGATTSTWPSGTSISP